MTWHDIIRDYPCIFIVNYFYSIIIINIIWIEGTGNGADAVSVPPVDGDVGLSSGRGGRGGGGGRGRGSSAGGLTIPVFNY